MKDQLYFRVFTTSRSIWRRKMVALQISPKIESLYGLGRQAKKLEGFVRNFATFARFPFGQFSTENS